MIWLVPGVIAAVLALPVFLAFRACLREVTALRGALGSFVELGSDVGSLRADVAALRSGLPEKGFRTRPAESAAS